MNVCIRPISEQARFPAHDGAAVVFHKVLQVIVVKFPPTHAPERAYIVSVIFHEFLGIDVAVQPDPDRRDILLTDRQHTKRIVLADTFFSLPLERWLTQGSMPGQPLRLWNAQDSLPEANLLGRSVPVIYGEDPESASFFRASQDEIYIGLDVLGSAFFMLSRYEELVTPTRDEHNRFPPTAALAFKEGFLERPIVDEYVEILWACMHRLWPRLERRDCQYEVQLTHDVDKPFGVKGQSMFRLVKGLGGDVLVRRSLSTAVKRLGSFMIPGDVGDRLDPNNTFDWLMRESESAGLKSAFFFMAGKTSSFDSGYDVKNHRFQRLFRRIHERGHEIGIHPSYGTYQSADLIAGEVAALRTAMETADVFQDTLGGRHHFLRWDASQTWQHWDAAGLTYDSTLCYAQQPGFRTGTCREYPVFSMASSKALRLTEHPLIVMEGSLLQKKYLALSPDETLEKIAGLSSVCRRMRGTFGLLWHNNSLLAPSQRRLFKSVLQLVKR